MQPQMSTHADGNTEEVGTVVTESSEESNFGLSSELVDERIKVNVEPKHALIYALTEMMNKMIQSILTTESTTLSTQGLGLHHKSP